MITDITHSFSWESVEIIRKICKPLFQNTNIKYFDFARVFKKNHMLMLFSDGDYTNFFLNHSAYKSTPPPISYPGYHLWQSYIDSDFLTEVKQEFKYGNGITIVKHSKTHTDIFNFATGPENKEALALYLNQPELLDNFINYFLEQIHRHIKSIDKKDLITIPRAFTKKTEIVLPEQNILTLFPQNKFYLQVDGRFIPISKRESQCLALLLKGHTAKMIGKKLGISYRTVETYCDKMREKTNSNTRTEMLGKVENKHALKELVLDEIN